MRLIYKEPYPSTLVMTEDQIRELANRFNAAWEPMESIEQELLHKGRKEYQKFRESHDQKDLAVAGETLAAADIATENLKQLLVDFGSDVSEVVDERQLAVLRGLVITRGIAKSEGGLWGLYRESITSHGLDMQKLDKDKALQKRLSEIYMEHSRSLAKLNRQTTEKILAELPPEYAQAFQWTLGIDTLKKPDETNGER